MRSCECGLARLQATTLLLMTADMCYGRIKKAETVRVWGLTRSGFAERKQGV